MTRLTRITFDPEVMGGKPCIRGLRVTVGTIVGLVAAGRTIPEVLSAYPYPNRGKAAGPVAVTPVSAPAPPAAATMPAPAPASAPTTPASPEAANAVPAAKAVA